MIERRSVGVERVPRDWFADRGGSWREARVAGPISALDAPWSTTPRLTHAKRAAACHNEQNGSGYTTLYGWTQLRITCVFVRSF